jgi:hypothetical protein
MSGYVMLQAGMFCLLGLSMHAVAPLLFFWHGMGWWCFFSEVF